MAVRRPLAVGTNGVPAEMGGGDTMPSDVLPSATDSAAGVVELATVAEAEAGTDTARATTPAGVLAAINKKITVSITAPSSPSVGDIWVDIS